MELESCLFSGIKKNLEYRLDIVETEVEAW